MIRRLLSLAIPAVILITFSGIARSQKSDVPTHRQFAEDKALQGKWKLVDVSSNEKELDAHTKDPSERLSFTDKEVAFAKNGKELGRYKYRIDPTKNPKEIDFDNPDPKEEGLGLGIFGIYAINKNELVICGALRLGGRPTSFDPAKEKDRGHVVLVTFKRD